MKSGGILIASDLHAHTWSRFASTRPDGKNSRFADLLDVLDQIETAIAEHGPDTLVLLGDLTHRRYFVQFSTYTPLMAWTARMIDRYQLDVIVVVGNHDIESTGHHALGPFQFIPGVTVVDRPRALPIKRFGRAVFVPYMPDDRVPTAFREYLDTLGPEDEESRLAFTHFALDGHVLNTDHEYALPTSLRYDDVACFERVFFGHVHTPCTERNEQLVYVGAPLHFDFGDQDERYCWYVEPTAKGTVHPIELFAPQFVTARYPRVPICALPKSGFLRVLNTPASMFAEIKRTALDVGWLACEPVTEAMPREAVRVLSSGIVADERLVREYVERYHAVLDEDSRARLLATGLRYLAEATNA